MFLENRLKIRSTNGTLRSLKSTQGLIDLTSNDYFGFARMEGRRVETFQTGSTGSRLLTGNHSFYEELETQISNFHKGESCLIYNSGYNANLGLVSAIGTEDVTFLYDLDIHASIVDGMRLSKAKKLPFRHNDLYSLDQRLKKSKGVVFVLVESIYSISGDFAPLQEISSLSSKYGAHLIVDEAHATGICGEKGEGLVVKLGLAQQVFARVHTFSKALGAHGGCVIGSPVLKEFLINFSRPFIYSTALPMPMFKLIEFRYKQLSREAELHQIRIKTLKDYLCTKLGLKNNQTPIQPLYISNREKLKELSKHLQIKGLDVRAIVPPTTPRGKECLRVVLHSFNQEDEIDQLVEVLQCNESL